MRSVETSQEPSIPENSSRSANLFRRRGKINPWEIGFWVVFIIILLFMAFYNLEINPRPWHDEGDVLTVSRTLVEDGKYALKLSDGYETFGVIQSVGPTVILPVALVFKYFGAGLLQGRIVASIYLLLTILVFYLIGKELFGKRAAVFSIIVLLCSPGLTFLRTGRTVIGYVPALGLFLAGVFFWIRAIKSKNLYLAALSGLFVGLGCITKSQYLVIGFAAFGIITLLDLIYYRLGTLKINILTIIVASACVGAWNVWQWLYFGNTAYLENAATLKLLSQVTFAIRPNIVVQSIRMIIGSDAGHYYLFWGFIALFYCGFLGLKKNIQGLGSSFLFIFNCLWLGFFILLSLPWLSYAFAAIAFSAFFVGKLFDDLLTAFLHSSKNLPQEVRQAIKTKTEMPLKTGVVLGSLLALVTYALWVGFNFENVIELDVLDRTGEHDSQWPKSFALPNLTKDYLNQTVDKQTIIETAERELAILTDHKYHSPEESIILGIISYYYNGSTTRDYQLGLEYFQKTRPEYLVSGYYARAYEVYDMDFVSKYYELENVIGSGIYLYDIYHLKEPLP
jgi:4-amino-4-deoxy-L-arabinose transferase-like glycosyltransferase